MPAGLRRFFLSSKLRRPSSIYDAEMSPATRYTLRRIIVSRRPIHSNEDFVLLLSFVTAKEELMGTIEPLLDDVSEFLAAQVDENTRPAISASIAYKNKILWEGNYGKLSKTNDTKPTGNTIYRYESKTANESEMFFHAW